MFLPEILQHRANEQPNRRAYTFISDKGGEESLSYVELYNRCCRLALYLQALSLTRKPVLLLFPPGLDFVVAFFACLLSGVIAVPTYLPRRKKGNPQLLKLLLNSQATHVLTTQELVNSFRAVIDEEFKEVGGHSLEWVTIDSAPTYQKSTFEPEPEDIAFLQYTSGSTADPKGVVVIHDNLVQNSLRIADAFEHDADKTRGLVWLPPYHDMGLIGGILQPMAVGFPVVLMSPFRFMQNPLCWLEAITKYRITTSGGPNFAYALCSRRATPKIVSQLDLSCWQIAFNGAEVVRNDVMDDFYRTYEIAGFHRRSFFPCYGLAESTLFVSGGPRGTDTPVVQLDKSSLETHRVTLLETPITNMDTALSVVGCGALANEQELVLRHPDTQQLSNADEIGEVCLKSTSVATGYWRNTEASQATFHAQIKGVEGRFLATGDLGFVRNNELFITGRIKDLVIIRGRNYYPTDIEQVVESAHRALEPSGSAAFSVQNDGEEQLVLVLELSRAGRRENLELVQAEVRNKLSECLQLAVFDCVLIRPRSLPRTSSGKVQRRRCRELYLNQQLDTVAIEKQGVGSVKKPIRDHTLVPAKTKIETLLQNSVAELTHRPSPEISITASFKSLGLDSLGIMELKYRCESNLGIDLSLEIFLFAESLQQLAADIDKQKQSEQEENSKSLAEIGNDCMLTKGQEALWLIQRLDPSSVAYNLSAAVRIKKSLDPESAMGVFQKLMQIHPLLRARFEFDGTANAPAQRMDANIKPELWTFTSNDLNSDIRTSLKTFIDKPFSLSEHSFRVVIAETGEDEFIVACVMHHIICDFWSLSLLLRQFIKLYTQSLDTPASGIVKPNTLYPDFVCWQHKQLIEQGGKHKEFWSNYLGTKLPVLNLPTDYPRPKEQTSSGENIRFEIGEPLARELQFLAKDKNTTLSRVLLAAFQVILHRYSGQDLILVGVPTSGRSKYQFKDVFGYFVNPVTVKANFSGDLTFTAFLRQVDNDFDHILVHQDYPFAQVVADLMNSRDPSRTPIFQTMCSHQSDFDSANGDITGFALGIENARVNIGGLEIESIPLLNESSQFDLSLTTGITKSGLTALFEYNTDLFEKQSIQRFIENFTTLLDTVSSDPDKKIRDLDILSDRQQQQLTAVSRGISKPEHGSRSFIKAFIDSAKSNPNSLALICGDEQLSYRDLNQRSIRLAAYLSEKTHDLSPIAIVMATSINMLIAIFSVLRLGLAYVPISSKLPPNRIASIISKAGCRLALTNGLHLPIEDASELLANCQEIDVRKYFSSEQSKRASQISPLRDIQPDTTACIIFTSGSSGEPKGVVLTHGGINNLVHSFIDSYHPTADDCLLPLTAPMSASFVGEIFPLLCVGGRLVLAQEENFLDLKNLISSIDEYSVSILSAVPSFIKVFNQNKSKLTSVRLLLSGGENISWEDIDLIPDSVDIVNSYGLTETTVCTSFYRVGKRPSNCSGEIPIGKPISNVEILLLDKYRKQVPIGCVGEIYVSGAGVAKGYLDVETETKFIAHPFAHGERLFRTGDLAKRNNSGELIYLGRADRQVQIHGNRVEPKEVERILKTHPCISDAVVTTGVDNEKAVHQDALVAYCVYKITPPSVEQLREWLSGHVPNFMLPRAFIALDKLPLNRNGKLDLASLPKATFERPVLSTQFLSPQSALEHQIVSIWQEVLGMSEVGVSDSFFELGGNSILAVKVHHRLENDLGLKCDFIELFKHPNIKSLAKELGSVSVTQSSSNLPKKAGVSSIEAVRTAAMKRRNRKRISTP